MNKVVLLGTLISLAGCASTTPINGALYADVKGPLSATSNPRGTASGEACAKGYLGLIALGDASITAAAKAGGISSISHVEQHTTSILGIIVTYCTTVWGQKGGAGRTPQGKAAAADGIFETTSADL